MPPIPISTSATRAFVGGAAVPGTTGSSVMVDAEPNAASSTQVAAVKRWVNCLVNGAFRLSLTFLSAAVSVCEMTPTL
jgi:hypothetical protein